MAKIVVPEEMLKAAEEAGRRHDGFRPNNVEVTLEAALLWLSENPIVPTPEEALQIFEELFSGPLYVYGPPGDGVPLGRTVNMTREQFRRHLSKEQQVFADWQKKMFLSGEPAEDYADRILKNASPGYTPTHAELDKIWNHIFLAGHGWQPPKRSRPTQEAV